MCCVCVCVHALILAGAHEAKKNVGAPEAETGRHKLPSTAAGNRTLILCKNRKGSLLNSFSRPRFSQINKKAKMLTSKDKAHSRLQKAIGFECGRMLAQHVQNHGFDPHCHIKRWLKKLKAFPLLISKTVIEIIKF